MTTDSTTQAVEREKLAWLPAEDAPNGCSALIRNRHGLLGLAYKTLNEPPFLQDWRWATGPERGQQAPWPTEYAPMDAILQALASHTSGETPSPSPDVREALEAAIATALGYEFGDGYVKFTSIGDNDEGPRDKVRRVASAALSALQQPTPGGSERVTPRPYPHAIGATKYSEYLGFEGGSLTIKTKGYGDEDGNGWMCFEEESLEWETGEEDRKTYRILNLPNSELICIRDRLNEIFPSTPGGDGEAVGWRLVPVEMTEDMLSASMVAAQLESVDKPFMWANAVRAAYHAALGFPPKPSPAPSEGVREAGWVLDKWTVASLRIVADTIKEMHDELEKECGGRLSLYDPAVNIAREMYDQALAALSPHKDLSGEEGE